MILTTIIKHLNSEIQTHYATSGGQRVKKITPALGLYFNIWNGFKEYPDSDQ